MIEHWLLYTSHREHGGCKHLGIFESSEAAWDFYYKSHDDEDERYYSVPFVEQWKNDTKIVG